MDWTQKKKKKKVLSKAKPKQLANIWTKSLKTWRHLLLHPHNNTFIFKNIIPKPILYFIHRIHLSSRVLPQSHTLLHQYKTFIHISLIPFHKLWHVPRPRRPLLLETKPTMCVWRKPIDGVNNWLIDLVKVLMNLFPITKCIGRNLPKCIWRAHYIHEYNYKKRWRNLCLLPSRVGGKLCFYLL